jgi:DNA-binding MarR family transcriptional regulator
MAKRATLSIETTHLVRDSCLCLHVQRAARVLARRFDEALKPAGLTHGQFSLMISLNRPSPPSIGSVATLLAMDRTTVTANLKPLQRRGLVTLSVDANDRRSRRMALTRAGRRQLAAALPYWEAAQAETARLIARTRPDRLISLLRALS